MCSTERRMRPRRLRRVIAAVSAGLVLTGAGVGWAVDAHATPQQDWAFIHTLDHFGIYYSSTAAAVDAGHALCDGLDAGLSVTALGVIAMNAGYTTKDAGTIVGAAIGAYCDQYAYLVQPRGQLA